MLWEKYPEFELIQWILLTVKTSRGNRTGICPTGTLSWNRLLLHQGVPESYQRRFRCQDRMLFLSMLCLYPWLFMTFLMTVLSRGVSRCCTARGECDSGPQSLQCRQSKRETLARHTNAKSHSHGSVPGTLVVCCAPSLLEEVLGWKKSVVRPGEVRQPRKWQPMWYCVAQKALGMATTLFADTLPACTWMELRKCGKRKLKRRSGTWLAIINTWLNNPIPGLLLVGNRSK